LGAFSKQGISMMRYLLAEAASRLDLEVRRDYQRLSFAAAVGWPKSPSHENQAAGSRAAGAVSSHAR